MKFLNLELSTSTNLQTNHQMWFLIYPFLTRSQTSPLRHHYLQKLQIVPQANDQWPHHESLVVAVFL